MGNASGMYDIACRASRGRRQARLRLGVANGASACVGRRLRLLVVVVSIRSRVTPAVPALNCDVFVWFTRALTVRSLRAEKRGPAVKRTRTLAAATLGMSLLFGALSGGTGNAVVRTANTKTFCKNYVAAAKSFQLSFGDVQDPSFDKFVKSLQKAQADAPAAVRGQVDTMLKTAKKIKEDGGNADLTTPSKKITKWATTHC